MKKFRCTVCNYIHIGDNPPERCPVCGASHDKFVLIEEKTQDIEKIEQDLYCDLVVVGSGAAALSAACFAKAKGLDVIIVEKAEEFGGTTKRSGGRYWIPNNKQQKELGIIDDKDDCLKYMVRLSYPELYNEKADNYGLDAKTYLLFEAYYENANKAVEKLAEIGVMESVMDYCWKKIPFCDYQDGIQQPLIRGRTILPLSDKGHLTFGTDLIEFLLKYLNKEDVKMYSNFRVINLLRDGQKALGIIGRYNNQYVNIHASKGVFFGTGGFSHNLDMMNKFQRGNNYGGCAVPSNEGDLVNIALKNSLGLANMQNAYHVQSMLEVYLANPDGASSMFYHLGDSTIQVNKYGKRFMNEKRNYNDRTMYHYDWDANNADWPNRLAFMIFDARMATLWQGFPPLPVGDPKESFYIISGQTLDELSDNIKDKLESLKDKVPNFKLEPEFKENLKETIKIFNNYALTGKDLEFNRGDYVYDQEFTTFPPTIPDVKWPDDKYPNLTMYPFSDEGPYYAIILAAGTLDTNGGIIVNEKAQVVDAYNKVIENLYAGGNCVAAFNKAGYYGAGGTIGPAFTNAYLAIENITKK